MGVSGIHRRQHAVRQPRIRNLGVEVVSVLDAFGVAQRDDGFDFADCAGGFESETLGGVLLDFGGGHELRFDDDRRAVRGGDEDVGLQSAVSGDGLSAL